MQNRLWGLRQKGLGAQAQRGARRREVGHACAGARRGRRAPRPAWRAGGARSAHRVPRRGARRRRVGRECPPGGPAGPARANTALRTRKREGLPTLSGPGHCISFSPHWCPLDGGAARFLPVQTVLRAVLVLKCDVKSQKSRN